MVGAGIAGLAAALELQSAGCDVLVVDPSDRPGGVMRTDHRKGFVVESGPSTAIVSAPMLDFLAKRGLHGGLLRAAPASRKRFLYRDGRHGPRARLAAGGSRARRCSPARAKLRALTEPFRRRGTSDAESVAEFVGRRLGREVSSSLVGPFLTGIYAGDEEQLGASAVFPRWVDRERRYGSLALGGLARPAAARRAARAARLVRHRAGLRSVRASARARRSPSRPRSARARRSSRATARAGTSTSRARAATSRSPRRASWSRRPPMPRPTCARARWRDRAPRSRASPTRRSWSRRSASRRAARASRSRASASWSRAKSRWDCSAVCS